MHGRIGRVVVLTALTVGVTVGTAAAQAGPTTVIVPPGTLIVQPGRAPVVIEPGQRVIVQPGGDVQTSYSDSDRLRAGYNDPIADRNVPLEYGTRSSQDLRHFLDEQALPSER
jgi:hypothetical protein